MSNKTNKEGTAATLRRRGRPAGKNRIPLSVEERRARNAQYERERRNEYAEAMGQLAEAAGCEASITNTELLATVISQIQRAVKRTPGEDLENLRRINENLESQIAALTSRLEEEPEQHEMHAAKKFKPSSEISSNFEPSSQNFSGKDACSSYSFAAVDQFVHVNGAKGKLYLQQTMKSARVCPSIESSTDSHYPQSEPRSRRQSQASEEISTRNTTSSSSSCDSDSYNSSKSECQELQLELRNETSSWSEEMSMTGGGKTQPQFYHNEFNPESNINEVRYEASYELGLLPLGTDQYNPSDNKIEISPGTQANYENLGDVYLPLATENQVTPESDMLDLLTDSEKCLITQWLTTSDVGNEVYETENYGTEGVHRGGSDFIPAYF